MSGPLDGVRIVELAGIGPGPYAGMLLADMGADVVVVERPGPRGSISIPTRCDFASRGKRSIIADLKTDGGREVVLRLAETAEILFEGFRPGVVERLGVGPETCLERNPALVYGRVTGWGQQGPLASAAGHDLNYIALSGALAAIGPAEKPVPPLNLVGDYAGGSLFLVIGLLAALIEARMSGQGQVVDAAITDGAANLMTVFHGLAKTGMWGAQRESNLLDGGAHFYNVFETADGHFVSIAAIEPKFYRELIDKAELDDTRFDSQIDSKRWPELRAAMARVVRTKTRDEWCELLEGTDACFAPVLDLHEAADHPHHQSRETFVTIDGAVQPAPAPRFSRTPGQVDHAPREPGVDTEAVLTELGFDAATLVKLRAERANR